MMRKPPRGSLVCRLDEEEESVEENELTTSDDIFSKLSVVVDTVDYDYCTRYVLVPVQVALHSTTCCVDK